MSTDNLLSTAPADAERIWLDAYKRLQAGCGIDDECFAGALKAVAAAAEERLLAAVERLTRERDIAVERVQTLLPLANRPENCECDALRADVERLTAERDTAIAARDFLSRTVDTVDASRAEARRERDAAVQRAEAAEAERDSLRRVNVALGDEYERTRDRLDRSDAGAVKLAEERDAERAEVERLTAALAAIEHEAAHVGVPRLTGTLSAEAFAAFAVERARAVLAGDPPPANAVCAYAVEERASLLALAAAHAATSRALSDEVADPPSDAGVMARVRVGPPLLAPRVTEGDDVDAAVRRLVDEAAERPVPEWVGRLNASLGETTEAIRAAGYDEATRDAVAWLRNVALDCEEDHDWSEAHTLREVAEQLERGEHRGAAGGGAR